jgi:hypothetical protein
MYEHSTEKILVHDIISVTAENPYFRTIIRTVYTSSYIATVVVVMMRRLMVVMRWVMMMYGRMMMMRRRTSVMMCGHDIISFSFRTCSHRICAWIFEHNFDEGKAKKRKHTIVW